MDSFLRTLHNSGFSEAAAAYRAFCSFLLGHLLLEVSACGADNCLVPPDSPHPAATDGPSGLTILERYEPALAEDHTPPRTSRMR